MKLEFKYIVKSRERLASKEDDEGEYNTSCYLSMTRSFRTRNIALIESDTMNLVLLHHQHRSKNNRAFPTFRIDEPEARTVACLYRRFVPPQSMDHLIVLESKCLNGNVWTYFLIELQMKELHSSEIGYRRLREIKLDEATDNCSEGWICECDNNTLFVTCRGMRSVHEIKIRSKKHRNLFKSITNAIPIVDENYRKRIVSSMSLINGKCKFSLLALTFPRECEISIFAVLHERTSIKNNYILTRIKSISLYFTPGLCLWVSRINTLLVSNYTGNCNEIYAMSGLPNDEYKIVPFLGQRAEIKSWSPFFDHSGSETGLLIYENNSESILNYEFFE